MPWSLYDLLTPDFLSACIFTDGMDIELAAVAYTEAAFRVGRQMIGLFQNIVAISLDIDAAVDLFQPG